MFRPTAIQIAGPRHPLIKLFAALSVLCASTLIAVRAQADEGAFKIKRTIKLDSVGNADIRLQVAAPTNLYTAIKTKTPNIAVLLRKLGAGREWAVLENVDGSFNDMQSTIDIHFTQRGLARVEYEQYSRHWPLQLGA